MKRNPALTGISQRSKDKPGLRIRLSLAIGREKRPHRLIVAAGTSDQHEALVARDCVVRAMRCLKIDVANMEGVGDE